MKSVSFPECGLQQKLLASSVVFFLSEKELNVFLMLSWFVH